MARSKWRDLGAPEARALPSSESPTLAVQVHNELRLRILRHELTPGTLVSAKAMAVQMRVSRTPVKDAMLALAQEGLLKSIGGSGFFVASVKSDDLLEILSLLMGIEAEVAAHLARQHTVHSLMAELRVRLTNVQDHVPGASDKSADSWAHFELHREFQVAMAELALMTRAARYLAVLFGHFRLYTPHYMDTPAALVDDDVRIVGAIAEGNVPAVRVAVEAHAQRMAARWVPGRSLS